MATDYVYSKLRSSNLAPELPFVHDKENLSGPVDVYLIPLDGFSEDTAVKLAMILSKELKINIQTTLTAPIDQAYFNKDRKQYEEMSLYKPIVQILPTLKNKTKNTAYLALLNADMYPKHGEFNYVFSCHWENRISVVATGRLIPYGVFSEKKAQKIYGERLLKLVKRTIGQQYFGFPRSSRVESVMYSPLMGTPDLDRMGYEF